MGWFRNLKADPADLTHTERTQSVSRFALLVILCILLVLLFAWPAVWQVTQEAVVYAGLALFRLVAAFVVYACAVVAAFYAFQWLENTQLGLRLKDDRWALLVACFLAAGLVFARVVL